MLIIKIIWIISNFFENVAYQIKPIRKLVVKNRRKKTNVRNGISSEYKRMSLRICKELGHKIKLDEREYLLQYFYYYKVCLYRGIVINASYYIDYHVKEETKKYNSNKRFFNKVLYLIPIVGELHERNDRIRYYLLDITSKMKEELKPLLNELKPSEEYFALFSENYVSKEKPIIGISTQRTTIGNLTTEQTNEFWKKCNDRFFKHCTESDFISSFQIDTSFTLAYKTKSALYVLCPFIEKSSLYKDSEKKLILNKILECFDIHERDYSKNAIRQPNLNHSDIERENYRLLEDFFISYGLISQI